MPELHPYPRFSLVERDRRWKAVREKMAEQNIDVIVTPQNTGHSMDFQANTRYLTHCGGGGDADIAAVFPLNGAVTAIATTANPRWTTTQDWTTDVREARREYGKDHCRALERIKNRTRPHRHRRPRAKSKARARRRERFCTAPTKKSARPFRKRRSSTPRRS